MKKIFTGLAASMIVLSGALTASAVSLDGTIELGTTYTVADFGNASGQYTTSSAGTFTVTYSTQAENYLFSDSDYSNEIQPLSSGWTDNDEAYIYTYFLKANQTVYYYCGFAMTGFDVSFSFEPGEDQGGGNEPVAPALEVTAMTPESGSQVATLKELEVSFTFNEPVTSQFLYIYQGEDNSGDPMEIIEFTGSGTTISGTLSDVYPDLLQGYTYALYPYVKYEGQDIFVYAGYWEGTTNPQSGQTSMLLSVSPENGSEVQMEETVINLQFNEPVEVTYAGINAGSGSNTALEFTSANNGQEWNITIPEKELNKIGRMTADITVNVTGANGEPMQFEHFEGGVSYYDENLTLSYPIFGAKNYGLANINVQTPPVGAPGEVYGTEDAPLVLQGPVERVNVIAVSNNPVGINNAYPDVIEGTAVYNAAGALVTGIDMDATGPDPDEGRFYIVFEDAVTAEGLYYVYIPELAFDITADSNNATTYYNNELKAWFRIGNATVVIPDCPEATVNPANNSAVSDLDNITISWGAQLSNLNKTLISVNQVQGNQSMPLEFSAYISPAIEEGDSDQLVISVDNPEGNVEVVVGENAINMLVDDQLIGNDALTLNYQIVEFTRAILEAQVVENQDPETGSIIGWTLTWEGVSASYFSPTADALTVTSDSSETYTVTPGVELQTSDGVLTIDLSALPEGIYSMELPQGYIWLGNDYENASESLSIKTTGVGSLINGVNVASEIYNLRGVRVSNPAKGGIYIINGKKILVK